VTSAPDFRAAAQSYIARGWRVVPLCAPAAEACTCRAGECTSPGKRPTAAGWTETIFSAELWANGARRNIGIVTGSASGLVVIDVDAGGDATLGLLEQELGALPSTVQARTGSGGRHMLFAHPGVKVRNDAKRKLGPGLDVRGDGGQIVAAPSLHKSGNRYEWIAGAGPGDRELAKLPTPWLARLVEPPAPPVTPPRPALPASNLLARCSAYLASCDPAIEGSNGSGALMHATSALVRGFRLPETEAFELLAGEYNLRCVPPWSDKELQHAIAGAAAKSDKPWGYLLEEQSAQTAPREPGCDDGEEPPPLEEENPPGPGARRTSAAASEPWPIPIPFDCISVPDFPTHLLPDWQRRFVDAVALETETRPDLAALTVLTVTAAACARRFVVEQRPGFNQPAAIWTLTMLSSGNRKSAVFDRAVAPLRDYEARKEIELGPRIAAERSTQRMLLRRLQKAEKTAVDAKEDLARRAADVERLAFAEQLAHHRVTAAPRLFLSEATPERLEEVLMEQGGRAAVLAAEPALFRSLAGLGSKANSDPNLTSILDAYDAGDVRVGRMKRDDGSGGDRIVRGAVVTIGLAPQPERVFAALRSGQAFLDSGFVWRFLLSLPGSLLGRRTHATPATPEAVRNEYAARVLELLELPDPGEGVTLPVIRPTDEAREALLSFERQLEPAMAADGELAAAVPWASKLTSKLARIAGLLHAAEHRREPWLSPLELRTMERAIEMAKYFIPHARSVLLELGADGAVKRGRRALEWIRKERCATFTQRDLHRAIAMHEPAGTAERVLHLLAEHDFIRRVESKSARGAGRPSAVFEVNPHAFKVQNAV
jgi:hypothetical protein